MTYLGLAAGLIPKVPASKALPVKAPYSVDAESDAVKLTANQAGFSPAALRAHRPLLLPAVPQPAIKISVFPGAKRSPRVPPPTPSMSFVTSYKAASADWNAICWSRSFRVPRSPIKAICAPPIPSTATMIKIIMTKISDAPFCRCCNGLRCIENSGLGLEGFIFRGI